ncbi:MAG TPA: ABC transporter permease [Silvibacterium sp.]|nr:ABC transporter permease [Silvibacterium sp.]
MGALFQNIRYALRQLRKSPGFTFTVVLTLALGIGANTAVFTLFDQVLLRMLPVERPQQLVRFRWTGTYSGSASSFGGDLYNYFSYPMYKDLLDRNQVFSGILAADQANVGLSWRNQAEDEDAEIVSGNYFQVLGLKPALGRLLTPQDDTQKNGNPVLVLGYDYWRSHFAGIRDVVGQTVLINGHPFTVLGVAPQNFQSAIGGYKPGVFLPISMSDIAMPSMTPRNNLSNHQSLWLTLVARLKPGVGPVQAQASLAPLWHALRAQELTLYKTRTARFAKHFLDDSQLQVKDDSRGFSPNRSDLETPLIILMSMAGLLVAMCAINVATLLLLRAAARAREMSMRYALGANRSRIVSQLLVEGGLIGLAGALAGIALAPAVANSLVHLMVHANPGSEPYSATVDARMLLFTLAIALVASLLFSIAPVIHFMRPNLAETLRQNSGTASKGSQRFRKIAVGAQIALSVVLMGGAGLFVRTLDNLRNQPVGFQTANLAIFGLDPTNSGYDETRTPQVIVSALDSLRRIPGVFSVSATSDPELQGDSNSDGFEIQGYKPAEDEKMNFEAPWIMPGYFATLRQPLLTGREFTAADGKGQPKVAIVNLAAAKRFFGSPQNAIGHLIGESGLNARPDTRIIGVVGNVKHFDLRTEVGPAVYRPYLQNPHPGGVEVYVLTAQNPAMAEAAIRKTVDDMDPTLVVDQLMTMRDQINQVAADESALAILATGFSALAMVLAGVGLYGVLAYSTEQRTREIGVRLALGAHRSGVVLVVVREMVIIAAIAVALALPSLVAVARLFKSQLYGVSTFDPVALAVALIVTAGMVVLAAALPARRAAAVEPMQALRIE